MKALLPFLAAASLACAAGDTASSRIKTKLPLGYKVPVIDISTETGRQVIVDREKGQYLGHPSTLLLEDGHTMLVVYPKGHGKGAIVYKRSTDGGKTWSERLPTPASWATSLETPTLHRVVDAAGKKRIIMFSGLYPIRMAVSEDDGQNWSELKPVGNYGGIVAMGSVVALTKPGLYMALFHDDGRFIIGGDDGKPAGKAWRFFVYQVRSTDGGLTWSVPSPVAHRWDADLCEPGAVRSPDGKQIAVLLRENSRSYNSFVITSNDEGLTWSEPAEVSAALTGDRHVARYAPDGRLFISFRDTTHVSSTKGDWVAWVGHYEDLLHRGEGQYRIRLMHNHVTKFADCGYPGVELLPDGTLVATSYGKWMEDELNYVVSVRLKLAEMDAMAGK